jgi:hypothetical protein
MCDSFFYFLDVFLLSIFKIMGSFWGFCNCFIAWLSFNSQELLAPRPTSKLENHPLSTVYDWLFNIFAAAFVSDNEPSGSIKFGEFSE